MGPPRTSLATLLFRGAVLVGCTALLLGIVGIFHFGMSGAPQPDAATGEGVSVRLVGVEDLEGLQVTVVWRAAQGGLQSETGRAGPELGQWVFERAPPGTPLTLTVYRRQGGARRRVHEQSALFRARGDVVVQVERAD